MELSVLLFLCSMEIHTFLMVLGTEDIPYSIPYHTDGMTRLVDLTETLESSRLESCRIYPSKYLIFRKRGYYTKCA